MSNSLERIVVRNEKIYKDTKITAEGVELLRSFLMYGDDLYVMRKLKEADAQFRKMISFSENLRQENPDFKSYYFDYVGYERIGRCLEEQKKLTEAEEWYSKALDLISNLSVKAKYECVYTDLIASYLNSGRISEKKNKQDIAMNLYKEALRIYEKNLSESESHKARRNLALIYSSMGLLLDGWNNKDHEEAKKLHQKAHQILESLYKESKTVKSRTDLAASYVNLGRNATLRRCPREAEKSHFAALQIAKELLKESETAESNIDQAKTYKGQPLLDDVVNISRALMMDYDALAYDAEYEDRVEDVAAWLEKKTQLEEELMKTDRSEQSCSGLILDYIRLGSVTEALWQLDKAFIYYKKAEENIKACSEMFGQVYMNEKLRDIYNRLGRVSELRDDLQSAKDFYLLALKNEKEIPEYVNEIRLRENSGFYYNNVGRTAELTEDYITAEEYYRQSVLQAEKDDDTCAHDKLRFYFANFVRMVKRRGGSLDKEEWRGITRMLDEDFIKEVESTEKDAAELYHTLGWHRENLAEVEEAEKWMIKAMKILQEQVYDKGMTELRNRLVDVYTSLGWVLEFQGKANESEDWHQKALQLNMQLVKETESNEALLKLRILYNNLYYITKEQDKNEESEEWHRKAIEMEDDHEQ